ncbi:MAG: transglutaminase domain-containing protein [Nitrospirae bacterium]|nr:transglutaminase domain-containing protein [Nitrospirota bacterium]
MNAGGQTLNGDILSIVKEDLSALKPAQLPVSGLEAYLSATPLIQSEDPRIKKLAREIVGSEENSLKAARLLYEWVFNNIKKTPSITIPSAVDVLNAKKGDCNEHTTIYVALARAIGLPSQMLVGLVYRQGAFYYHAWPEVFAGKWIAMDPTLGEFPVDAKYIMLISGDLSKQLIIAKVINNISLEGMEYR